MRSILTVTLMMVMASNLVEAQNDLFPVDGFLPGWRSTYSDEYRDGSGLFDYMNGGAELYLEYKFLGLKVKEYESEAGESLTIEIYSYAKAEDAYGIFSVDTTGIPIAIGDGGRTAGVMTRFWKGNHYVRAFTWASKPELVGVPEAGARVVAENIGALNALPDFLDKLLKGGMHPVFVRGEIALRQVTGNWHPGTISISRKGAAWILPETSGRSGAIVFSYSGSDILEIEFEALKQRIISHVDNFVATSDRVITSREDGSSDGLLSYRSTDSGLYLLIWVPSSINEAVCAETIDSIEDVYSGDKE